MDDELESLYRDFGINVEAANDENTHTLPMPARYVIDSAGVITAADVHADYTKRPEPEKTLADLRALKDR